VKHLSAQLSPAVAPPRVHSINIQQRALYVLAAGSAALASSTVPLCRVGSSGTAIDGGHSERIAAALEQGSP
jgi:hypothetical protein